MFAEPAACAVTTPVTDTVATAMFDDCHVACAVTSRVKPLDNFAEAVN
jgi:hypothetical protein